MTETRRGKTHIATAWHLASRHRAPWKWIPPQALVNQRGTAVKLHFADPLSPLIDPGFIETVLRRHYQPLLDPAQYAYVSSVYVLPNARERGVLHAMLAAADAWCVERGLDEMRLHNAADNPLANAAWEALGFEVVEHLRVRSLGPR